MSIDDSVAAGSTPPAWATETTRSRSRMVLLKTRGGTSVSGTGARVPAGEKTSGDRCGWRFTKGVSCLTFPSGRWTTHATASCKHGPWPPEECSRWLLAWFDHGWITLYVLSEQLFRWSSDDDALIKDPADETVRIVERDRARAILAEPRTWTNDRPEGFLCLAPADHAPSSDFRQLWLDAIAPPR
jgi:hypothetical protein